LAEEAGGFPYIKKTQELRANLDGFFFEIISAKDFFLQGINDHYVLGLPKRKATKIAQLEKKLDCKGESEASKIVGSIKEQLRHEDTWISKLNNYRNSATHRQLLPLGHEVKASLALNKALYDTIAQAAKEGSLRMIPISRGQEQLITPDIPKVQMPPESIKTYLFKDPEEPQKGNMDTEVLPYCEQSLEQMRDFLENSYNGLGI